MDSERQQDELLALGSIFDSATFALLHNDDSSLPEGIFTADLNLPSDFVLVCKNTDDGSDLNKVQIEHLPPVTIHFVLPPKYPSMEPPWYLISCSWLSRHQLSIICGELDKIWDENNCEVLFLWFQFVKEDMLASLKIVNSLDISFLLSIRKPSSKRLCNQAKPDDESIRALSPSDRNEPKESTVDSASSKSSSIALRPLNSRGCGRFDGRAVSNLVCGSSLLLTLTEYNHHQKTFIYNSRLMLCSVCYQERFGHQNMKFNKCDHSYCNECMKKYFTIQISDGNVKNLTCPHEKCSSQAHPSQVKELVEPKIFSKYDQMLLHSTLDTMNDVVYCPRLSCQCPVIADSETNMASCSSCFYVFCTYCKMAYHGIEPCSLKQDKLREIREAYVCATPDVKQHLEKQYGRKNLQKLIENTLSQEWMESNSKSCPKCHCPIEKIDGCNKITCWRCTSMFCWLCNKLLDSERPYLHFNVPNTKCYDQLFRGIDVNDEDELEYEMMFGQFL